MTTDARSHQATTSHAAVSLGYMAGKRVHRKVTGRTKTEVKAKLRDLRRDLGSGVRSSATYTVGDALDDWLANGLSGRSDRTNAHSGTRSPSRPARRSSCGCGQARRRAGDLLPRSAPGSTR